MGFLKSADAEGVDHAGASQSGPATQGSVQVAIVDDYEVVVRGLAQMIGGDPRLRVVELDSMVDPSGPVDVVLFDSFAAEQGAGSDILRLVRHPYVGKLVVYTWNMDPGLVDQARRAGVAGYLSKRLSGSELVEALLRVHAGERVFNPASNDGVEMDERGEWDWPGREAGLSAREAEVVGLIVQGLTNEQIAKRAYLSINSVKTYIRSAYRKMGVERRSQAVLWGIEHGFMPRATIVRSGTSADEGSGA